MKLHFNNNWIPSLLSLSSSSSSQKKKPSMKISIEEQLRRADMHKQRKLGRFSSVFHRGEARKSMLTYVSNRSSDYVRDRSSGEIDEVWLTEQLAEIEEALPPSIETERGGAVEECSSSDLSRMIDIMG